ncbi:hypothetical protein NDU88_005931 [Pleurodeles waltl]|uniref:Uncharacterized protein n=1 Tax=Pleurodeles waltl TaxID=8319 RepID=A0AAV7MC04_PLEWA|nr:hypothetical protein NDU88_005931 [Pleurodeles waltl]
MFIVAPCGPCCLEVVCDTVMAGSLRDAFVTFFDCRAFSLASFFFCSLPATMGKTDQMQSKLNFDEKKCNQASQSVEDLLQEEHNPTTSVKALFLDLKHSLASINAKLDYLTEQTDHLKERVDPSENMAGYGGHVAR